MVDDPHPLLECEYVLLAMLLQLEHLVVHLTHIVVVPLYLEQVVLHVVRLTHELALVGQVVEHQVGTVLTLELHVAEIVSVPVEQHETLLDLHQYQVVLTLY